MFIVLDDWLYPEAIDSDVTYGLVVYLNIGELNGPTLWLEVANLNVPILVEPLNTLIVSPVWNVPLEDP